MADRPRPHGFLRAFFKLPLLMYHGPLASLMGRTLCVITTRGRRTGAPRRSGLNYAEDGGIVFVMSGWGTRADWYRNIVADPHVTVRIGRRRWNAIARIVTDPVAKRRGVALLRHTAERQGPPRPLRPLLSRIGFDYDAELAVLDRDAPSMPLIALTRA
jgi:deazaflavin-dependent oxidoreductase (nitroreductase family)